MRDREERRRIWGLGALLALLVLAVYLPVTGFEFINFDDGVYVYRNPLVLPGITWPGVVKAFTEFHACNWHPLTWLSHMLDCQMFGEWAGGHHLVNVLWHAANSALVLAVLHRLTGSFWRSGFVAALFAVHPLHVESVAWVAERKDVLSTFFGLLAVWAYVRHGEETRKPAGRTMTFRVMSLVWFACSLMSKPMLVTLPCVLLLLDFWPLQRLSATSLREFSRPFGRLVVEKTPFFLLALGSCWLTIAAQEKGGAMVSTVELSLPGRVENALIAYATYLGKTFWPADLCVFYPYHPMRAGWQLPVALLVLMAVSLFAATRVRRQPYVLFGWLWFLGTLVPVIGLVKVGVQAWADRYTYVPLLGIFISVVWLAAEELGKTRTGRRVLCVVAASIFIACTVATTRQLDHWQNGRALFERALAVTTDNACAQNGMGLAFYDQGRYEQARMHYSEALRLNPSFAEAMVNLGWLLVDEGDVPAGIDWLRRGARLNPLLVANLGNLAAKLQVRGDYANAAACYSESDSWSSESASWANDAAWFFASCPDARFRNGREAVRLATRACELTRFRQAIMIGTLAAAEAEAGDFASAIRHAEQAAQTAEESGQNALALRNRELLELYRSGKTYHQRPPAALR